MPQDFSGQNLRGRNFKDQNLTGANFSHADIRGANFTNAILIGANFTKAEAGMQRRWAIIVVLVSLILSMLSGILSALTGLWSAFFFVPGNIDIFNIIFGVVVLIVLAVFFIVIIREGLGIVVGAGALALALVGVLAILGAGAVVQAGKAVGAGTAVKALALVIVGVGTGAVVGALTAAVAAAGAVAVAAVVAGAVAGAGVGAAAGVVTAAVTATVVGAMAVAGAVEVAAAGPVAVAVAVEVLGIYIAWRALAGDEKHTFVRKIALFFASTGGTNFRNANLTDADFTQTTLKCTKFIGANLTRTRFYEAKKLLLARVGKSILDPLPIRTLLVTGNGRNKSYINANLRGANLIGADLSGANLKGANISDATFQGANLETANLTLTEAIGTDFTRAQMTGACVEAWNIESNTKLDNVDCRFIYLLEYPKPGTDDRERRPSSGEFAPGEFTKLFQEVLTTVDLIFRNGVDWKAFTAAFQKVQVENEDTELTIAILYDL